MKFFSGKIEMSPNETTTLSKTPPPMQQPSQDLERAAGSVLLKRAAGNSLLHAGILIAIVLYCFARTLGSYFLADDFGEICYIHRIFHGEPGLFWSNFTGNYMQIPGMSVYRPMLLITLVLDYLVWRAEASGYYLTNIVYFTGNCIMLYLLVKSMTAAWSPLRSGAIALLSAALFASYPLHCESISWVVGRVDIACCFFYLSSLYFLVRSRKQPGRYWLAASVASFWLGLLTKEMAIGLPVVVAAAGFFLFSQPAPGSSDIALSGRLRSAFAISWPFWLSTVFYFAVRYCVLGTFTGGYTGGIGHSQLSAILDKWSDLDTLRRLNLPLNYSVFHDTGIYPKALSALYTVLACTLAVRVIGRAMPWKWVLFNAVWLLSAAAPIYQLWGLGYNLEGSRFFFFLSVPLCVMTAVTALAPAQSGDIGQKLARRLTFLNLAALCLLVLLFARIAYLNNIPWVHAGKTVNKVRKEAEQLVKAAGENENLLVLGIPKENGGAHMILNGATFSMMMHEPFVKENYALRFLTFDPILFGNADLINTQRLKETLADGKQVKSYFWDATFERFHPIVLRGQAAPMTSSSADSRARRTEAMPGWNPCTASGAKFLADDNLLRIEAPSDGDGIELSNFDLNPLNADFIELTARFMHSGQSASVYTSWKGANLDGSTERLVLEQRQTAEPASILIPLSRYWRWYAAGTVKSLVIHFNDIDSVDILSARLVSAKSVAPHLAIKDASCSARGVYESTAPQLVLEFDASGIATASAIEFEVSRANFLFEQASHHSAQEAVLASMKCTATKGLQSLAKVDFSEPGYYQIRARALNKEGVAVGEFSDPLTVDRQKPR